MELLITQCSPAPVTPSRIDQNTRILLRKIFSVHSTCFIFNEYLHVFVNMKQQLSNLEQLVAYMRSF